MSTCSWMWVVFARASHARSKASLVIPRSTQGDSHCVMCGCQSIL